MVELGTAIGDRDLEPRLETSDDQVVERDVVDELDDELDRKLDKAWQEEMDAYFRHANDELHRQLDQEIDDAIQKELDQQYQEEMDKYLDQEREQERNSLERYLAEKLCFEDVILSRTVTAADVDITIARVIKGYIDKRGGAN